MHRNKLRAGLPRILWPPPPKCIAAIASDKQDLPAHRRRRLSESPAAPLPFPLPAPHRSRPAPPASLPTGADNAPAGWPTGSNPGRSTPHSRTPPPPPSASALPAPRTSHAHIPYAHTRLSYSTRRVTAPAPLRPAPPDCLSPLPHRPPSPQPAYANIPRTAPPSFAPTAPSRTPCSR